MVCWAEVLVDLGDSGVEGFWREFLDDDQLASFGYFFDVLEAQVGDDQCLDLCVDGTGIGVGPLVSLDWLSSLWDVDRGLRCFWSPGEFDRDAGQTVSCSRVSLLGFALILADE